jgi:glycosyltransferase involved in cell wall biosynthesis
MNVSVLILTLNEEINLPECLESVSWCDDVVVFDSFSSDRTEEIARCWGARFIQREFDNYSSHRNWALSNIEFHNEWVFSLDADERFTNRLAEEIHDRLNSGESQEYCAYKLRYKNMFQGRWLRHATLYPTWLIRLFRPERVRYENRSVNAHPVVDGQIGKLKAHFHHYSFTKGFAHWFHKHNRYSSMEALECLKELEEGSIVWKGLISSDGTRRRRALKQLSFRLPARPWLKFFYMYVLKRGFLDGMPGLTYCTLQAIYEYMIVLKMRELRRREDDKPI